MYPYVPSSQCGQLSTSTYRKDKTALAVAGDLPAQMRLANCVSTGYGNCQWVLRVYMLDRVVLGG